ncbi:hypothetical protein AHAS_Ahas05G0070900 [Arachis hypogaea]
MTIMLRDHRKFSDVDMHQINNFRDSGLGPSKIFGILTSKSKCYENVCYELRDIHNKISKQKCQSLGDAATVLVMFEK